jgi:H+-transporting ATPase
MADSVLDKHWPEHVGQGREIDSTNVITKFNEDAVLHFDDLKLANHVATHGTGINADTQFNAQLEREQKSNAEFVFNSQGLTSSEAEMRLQQYGRNEIPDHTDPSWLVFVRQFYAPMPIMIWIAILGEALIQNFADMSILLIIQFSNATISFYETMKAGNAVAALKASLKPTATVKRDGQWIVLEAAGLVPGDTVLLASGSAIPADCRVNDSEIDVNQASLTGESLPVTFYKGDSCKMGSTVVSGEVEVRVHMWAWLRCFDCLEYSPSISLLVQATVEFTGAATFFGKTASLIQNTHEPSHLQKILMTIMSVLVGLSVTLCAITFFYLLSKGLSAHGALSFTIVLLVASIPLAIEIVTTTTLAIGSKNLAAQGAIVTKLSAIEDLAGMSILCSDKTGTLTLNQMILQEDTPIYAEGETQESVLVLAALAAKWKEPARDALDRLTLGSVNMSLVDQYEQLDYLPFDPQRKRTEGKVRNMDTGQEFRSSKGAPHVILNLLPPSALDMRERVEKDVARLGEHGIRSLAVARCDSATDEWTMVGLLTFLDPPRPDTKQTIGEARGYGVQVKMITGKFLLAIGLRPHIETAFSNWITRFCRGPRSDCAEYCATT